MKAFAVYTRYGELCRDLCDSIDEARELLVGGSEAGAIFALGIYVPSTITILLLSRDDFPLPVADRVACIREACAPFGSVPDVRDLDDPATA